MIPDFGYGLVLISFGLAIYSIIASVFGYYKRSFKLVDSARLAMQLMFPLITISSVILMYLLATDSYYVSFVYEVTSRSMPMYLKITALWGGQSGSLLFWAWTLTAFSSAVTLREWDRDRDLLPWVVVVNSVTAAFFIGMIVFYENPFAKFWQTIDGSVITAMFQPAGAVLFTAPDGQGLNPLLRHPGMIIHPPMLYLGFVSYVIPFSFALAALITGRTDDRWTRITRRWSIVAWLFLSIGLILGGRWAYDVLGWGGYWGWDPVEIAAFMPWLVGTAFLHSVMIQEQRGMFKEWNMILIILTYVLVIFGTFLTRSGVLSSVHAFAQSAIGPAFFIFIGITIVISVSLLIYRWSDLKAESELNSLLSRESLFLLNNLLFISILIVCFWGVLFPLISELVTGQKVTVGPPFYERATGPLFAGLLFLMGIAPLSAWGKTTLKTLGRSSWKSATISVVAVLGFVVFLKMYNPYAIIGFAVVIFSALITLHEFWRAASARSRSQKENLLLAFWQIFGKNRRRYGGYLIHLSVIMMAIGIIGLEMFQTETQGTLRQGESITIRDYKVTYTDLAIFDTNDNRNLARAVVSIEKDGEYVGELYPRRDYFYESQQPMTIPGIRSTIEDDLYVLLVDWQPITAEGATFKIYHNPLVNWLWWGAYLMIIGSLVAMWPQKEKSIIREQRKISESTLLDQSEA